MKFYDFYSAKEAWAFKVEKERLGWTVSIPAFNHTSGLWYVTTNFGAWAR